MELRMQIASKRYARRLGLDGSTQREPRLTISRVINLCFVGLWMWTIFFAVLFRVLTHWGK
jgi:hypothetical protein